MRKLQNDSAKRAATLLALTPLLWLAGACERQGDEPEPGGAGAAAGRTAPSDLFTLPKVDLSDWPAGLRERMLRLREVVEKSPRNPDRVGTGGSIYFVRGFAPAAATCFERARELAPESMHWCYYAGLAYEQMGESEKATSAYERAIELDASYAPLYARLARLLLKSDAERAAKLFQRALELNAQDATALCGLGLCEEAAGEQTAALARFEEALKIAPDYKEAHEAMARVLAALGREEEAVRHREQATRGKTPLIGDHLFELLLRSGFHLEILLRDALALAETGEFERAEEVLARVQEADRVGTATHQATGMVRAMQGRLEEAAEQFRRVLQARPDALGVKARLADVQARLGQYEQAEAGFRAVLEQNPDDGFTLERYSRLLLILERGQEAEALLRDALERQPDEPWLRFQLGGLLLNLQKDDEAREQFQTGLEKSPDHAGARYSLGLLARRAGDPETARKEWERVVETTPDFLDAYVALTELAMQERDFAAAERYLRDGLKQAPDSAGLANGLAWILATAPKRSQRNGEEAVRLAERACELTQRRQHELLDTLAAAYAEVGRFDDAVKTAREAIRLAEETGDEEGAAGHRQRLMLYEKKQPYRETGKRG